MWVVQDQSVGTTSARGHDTAARKKKRRLGQRGAVAEYGKGEKKENREKMEQSTHWYSETSSTNRDHVMSIRGPQNLIGLRKSSLED